MIRCGSESSAGMRRARTLRGSGIVYNDMLRLGSFSRMGQMVGDGEECVIDGRRESDE